jgi:hypothetical protein
MFRLFPKIMFARKEYFLFSLFNPSVAFSKIKLNWGMSARAINALSFVTLRRYRKSHSEGSRVTVLSQGGREWLKGRKHAKRGRKKI